MPSSEGRSPLIDPIEGAYLPADTGRMPKKPEPPKLFWLIYRYSDGSAAGVVAVESSGLLYARLKASLAGADRELEFASRHQLEPESAGQIPANTGGRRLNDGDLRKDCECQATGRRRIGRALPACLPSPKRRRRSRC
jgi:hypothetical protein